MGIAEWRCLARDCSSGMTLLGVLEQCEAVKWTLAVFLNLAELRPLPALCKGAAKLGGQFEWWGPADAAVCALVVMRTTVDLRRAPWHRNAQRGPPLAGLRYEDPPPDALWSKMEQLLYTVHKILRPQTFADYYTALANYGVVPRQVLRLGPKAAAALQAAVREVALRGTGNQYKAMELSEGLEALARAMSGGILCEAAGRRHWLENPA